jgi:hypothetical protein
MVILLPASFIDLKRDPEEEALLGSGDPVPSGSNLSPSSNDKCSATRGPAEMLDCGEGMTMTAATKQQIKPDDHKCIVSTFVELLESFNRRCIHGYERTRFDNTTLRDRRELCCLVVFVMVLPSFFNATYRRD